MIFKFDDIFTRCQDISSYEGGRINDADGNSLYSVVHLTQQDKPLVIEYLKQIVIEATTLIGYAIDDMFYTSDRVDICMLRDNRISEQNVRESLEGVFTSYIMWKWLGDKSAERSSAWAEIHAEMVRVLPKSLRKKRPVI